MLTKLVQVMNFSFLHAFFNIFVQSFKNKMSVQQPNKNFDFTEDMIKEIYMTFWNPTKGQIMSECIYEIINFPKYHWKNLIDFCPGRFYRLGTYLCWLLCTFINITEKKYLVYKIFQGRNLSNFFSGILKNRWFHKYILTSSDL